MCLSLLLVVFVHCGIIECPLYMLVLCDCISVGVMISMVIVVSCYILVYSYILGGMCSFFF